MLVGSGMIFGTISQDMYQEYQNMYQDKLISLSPISQEDYQACLIMFMISIIMEIVGTVIVIIAGGAIIVSEIKADL